MLEDNKIISLGEYSIRVISKESTIRSRHDVIDMLNRLVVESETDMANSLIGQKLKNLTDSSKAWSVNDKWLSTFEETNKHALVVEKNGKPLAMTVFMINDPETRINLGVKGDFAIFIKALTEKNVRNTGILGTLVKVAESLISEVTKEPTFIGCVTVKPVVNSDGSDAYHVMNLERYATMYSKLFHNNQLQIRYKDKDGNQFGRDLFDMNQLFDGSKIDHDKVDSLVKKHQSIAAKEDKEVLGFYLVGDCPKKWVSKITESKDGIRSML